MTDKEATALAKCKDKAAKQANKIMKKAFASLKKELDSLLKTNGLWYSNDDKIKEFPDLHTASDRNGDQAIFDHFLTISDEIFEGVTPEHLWSKEDIEGTATA